jgi:hypothetical protein
VAGLPFMPNSDPLVTFTLPATYPKQDAVLHGYQFLSGKARAPASMAALFQRYYECDVEMDGTPETRAKAKSPVPNQLDGGKAAK